MSIRLGLIFKTLLWGAPRPTTTLNPSRLYAQRIKEVVKKNCEVQSKQSIKWADRYDVV